MMYVYCLFILVFWCSGCTFSVVTTGSSGGGSDLVDETDTVDADVKPELTVPASLTLRVPKE